MSNEATNPAKLAPIITRRIADLETFKISDKDTNYFAMIADPIRDQVPFSIFLEIFEPGGKTPWHRHGNAHEMFFVLSGEAKSVCDGMEVQVKAGESFIVRPGHEHEVINVGKDKLYCLTVMLPNEDFAELVRSGFRVALTPEDITTITERR
ncbi:MAG: cupin domain-containing protein [Roseomonas sp.]|nr:cupin domain-containing protein [Roseomonas sp.]